jgi:hypothetical protein
VVLEVSIKDDRGKKIYENTKVYMPQSTTSHNEVMVYGPTNKFGIIRDTSIQPFSAKEETFEVPVPKTVRKVKVLVDLSYQLRPGDVYPIKQVYKEIQISNGTGIIKDSQDPSCD